MSPWKCFPLILPPANAERADLPATGRSHATGRCMGSRGQRECATGATCPCHGTVTMTKSEPEKGSTVGRWLRNRRRRSGGSRGRFDVVVGVVLFAVTRSITDRRRTIQADSGESDRRRPDAQARPDRVRRARTISLRRRRSAVESTTQYDYLLERMPAGSRQPRDPHDPRDRPLPTRGFPGDNRRQSVRSPAGVAHPLIPETNPRDELPPRVLAGDDTIAPAAGLRRSPPSPPPRNGTTSSRTTWSASPPRASGWRTTSGRSGKRRRRGSTGSPSTAAPGTTSRTIPDEPRRSTRPLWSWGPGSSSSSPSTSPD